MFPDGQFKEIDTYTKNDYILAIYEVKDEGYIVKGTAYGYNTSTPIIVLIGFDLNGQTTGLAVLQEQETSGYGSRCFDDEYISEAYLHKASVNEIDTLSGATRTSEAMTRIMDAAFKAIQEVK
ncbi:MAG: FMN-binding protein [Erysipelotrichaceae bacterium]|nr:FMN-binding protein [Erysipelotrichaceae bacterium]